MSSYRDKIGFSRWYESRGSMGIIGSSLSLEDMIRCGILYDPCRMHEHDEDDDEDEDVEFSDSDVQWDVHQHRFRWDVQKQDFVPHMHKSRTVSTAEINDHQWDLCGLMDSYPDPKKEDCKINLKELMKKEHEEIERKEKLLEEKKEIKAEKKRLKKQRQKERKRLQKELESASTQDKETKVTDEDTLDKAGDEPGDDKTEECLNLKDMASALESDCSDGSSDGSSDEENEGLDLTSCFVTKAAEIVKRQLEQKQDSKDKKKSPVKEEEKLPEKSTTEENCVENHVEKKEISPSGPTMEDFVKMSAELAMIGNKQAAAGNFKLAVKYFTDAIRFNPTEYRLFGNRAFCFEKMQEFDKALNDAVLSLSMSPGWVKGLFRKGRALAGLKRYEEAADAFKEVIKLDRSCGEANQELVRMQILQLMEYGFTQDQCSKALIIHGSVDKAREFLSKFKNQSAAPPPPQQVVNVTGLSPILSAKIPSAAAAVSVPPPSAKVVPKTSDEPLIVVQSHHTLAKPIDYAPSKPNYVTQSPELFPVWVGNISFSATETLISNLFNKVGKVFSMKHLPAKRCAFINFTKQQDCEDAIRRYHGYELLGSNLAVRYPDRMPLGMNISKSAHKAADLAEEYVSPNVFPAGRNSYNRPVNPNYRYPYKY